MPEDGSLPVATVDVTEPDGSIDMFGRCQRGTIQTLFDHAVTTTICALHKPCTLVRVAYNGIVMKIAPAQNPNGPLSWLFGFAHVLLHL